MTRKLGRVKPQDWHVMVATPAYDGKVYTDYALSLAEAAFCSPLFHVRFTAQVSGNGCFIELARNIFVKSFLEDNTDCTHLFFIDADLKFPQNAFIGLVRSGLPICAGVYRRRQEPEEYPVKWVKGEDGCFVVENDFLMCERVPTGFLCIERQVLQEMSDEAPKIEIHGQKGLVPWVFGTKFSVEGDTPDPKFVGEDYTFCDSYRAKYGKNIPVWPDITFSHAGYVGNLHEFLNKKIREQDKSRAVQSTAA
jgi:hypothetical protein